MLRFARRCCRVFLRDRMSVFFSFLSVLIIIGLYVLFLGDMMRRSAGDLPGIGHMMDSWIMAGMIAASTFTTTLGTYGTMVDDRTLKIRKDFLASPMRRATIAGGYMISAVLLGLLLSVTTLVLAEGYIVLGGGSLLSLPRLLKALGIILLSVLSSSAMMFLAVSFVQSNNAFGVISTISGTLVGFLTGIYIPIGTLPGPVQAVIKCFPPSHAAVLLRQVFMDAPMAMVYAGAPAGTAEAMKLELGVVFQYGDAQAAPWVHALVLAGTFAVFFALSTWRVAKTPDR